MTARKRAKKRRSSPRRPFDPGTMPHDYRDMLRELHAAAVDFVVIGAWALGPHGYHRATKDIDVFVRATPENAPRVMVALSRFGAPLFGATVADFAQPGVILQIGVVNRIDITTTIEGVTFDEAVGAPVIVDIDGIPVRFIGREALIKNKLATGRPRDLLDAQELERLREA